MIGVEKGVFIVREEALCVFWGFLWRKEDVHHQSEGILQQLGNDPAEQTTTDLEGWISIDLTQPRLPHLVH